MQTLTGVPLTVICSITGNMGLLPQEVLAVATEAIFEAERIPRMAYSNFVDPFVEAINDFATKADHLKRIAP